MAQLTEQIEKLIQPIMDDLGLELVDLEYQREERGWILRFYLDKEGGINLDECAAASREISSLLDIENTISTAYSLEVSSPGIERPLKKIKDFERFSGQLAKIKTLDAIDPDQSGKKKKTFIGILSGSEGDEILIKLKNKTDVIRISLHQIDEANWVAEQIKRLQDDGGWGADDIAILYRINKMSEEKIGIIGGSGLGDALAERLTDVKACQVETPFGKPSDAVMVGSETALADDPVLNV